MCEKSSEKRENFDAILNRLTRHLEVNSDVTGLSEKFSALKKNFERVDFVINLLENAEIDVEIEEKPKNDEIAVKLREQGNQMYKFKKLKDAWELYTKSISYAEKNSVNLALAYANRSAVLFELNLHKQCIMDIGRALENNYPEHLKPKLFVREKNSRNLELASLKIGHEEIPTVTPKNPKIQSACDCVEIKEDEGFGRHVVASRDIKPGEILAIEKPFATVLVDQYFSHCHECINLCYNLIPCQSCTQAMYCSKTCRDRALESYHKYECSILATLRALEFKELRLLPLKIALLMRDQYQQIQSYQNDDYYCSDRYQEIHNLITNTSKRSVSDLFNRATAAAIIFNLVKKHTDFFDGLDNDCHSMFKHLLLLHMQTGPSNFHEIIELTSNRDVFEPKDFASGAFSFMSLLNHSCCPNVGRFYYGPVIVLRAIQTIKKGEQCYDNYGYHHSVMEKSERQKQLKSQYYFDCCCKACENNWPLYDYLPPGDPVQIEDSLYSKLCSANVETAKEVLDELLAKLCALEVSAPSKSFYRVQEIVKQCFASLGNKRVIF